MKTIQVNEHEYIISQILGEGSFGTTYLVKDKITKKNIYAIKVQSTTSSPQQNEPFYRELSVFQYLQSCSFHEQQFFTCMKDYEIKCNEKPKIPLCEGYIVMNYHKGTSLEDYLGKGHLIGKEYYSLFVQLFFILDILYRGGYAHNDLHSGNLIISKTKQKHYLGFQHRLPYCGIRIAILDYGESLHTALTLKKDNVFSYFKKNRKLFLFDEMQTFSLNIIQCWDRRIHLSKLKNKKLPWKLDPPIKPSLDRFIESKPEYFAQQLHFFKVYYPEGYNHLNKYYNSVIQSQNTFELKFATHAASQNYFRLLNCIITMFMADFPEEYSECYDWGVVVKLKLSREEIVSFLSMNTYEKLKQHCISNLC